MHMVIHADTCAAKVQHGHGLQARINSLLYQAYLFSALVMSCMCCAWGHVCITLQLCAHMFFGRSSSALPAVIVTF